MKKSNSKFKVKEPAKRLNFTLCEITKILNNNNIDNWFASYGTLLGLIRDNSCIENDDDIDIIIDNKYFELLKQILPQNGFKIITNKDTGKKITPETKDIIKTLRNDKYTSIDFYMVDIIDNNFMDKWNNVLWTNCLPIQKHKLNKIDINIPNNHKIKLIGRYGETWETPQQTKGPKPHKTVL